MQEGLGVWRECGQGGKVAGERGGVGRGEGGFGRVGRWQGGGREGGVRDREGRRLKKR